MATATSGTIRTRERSRTPSMTRGAPAYSPPSSGLLSNLPASWVPYGELARIDRPAGIYLFYFPHLFGTLFAAALSAHPPDLLACSRLNVVLFLGTALFRASACSWNDTMDAEYDKHVLRCRLRPLARGALEPAQAHIVTVVMALGAGSCLYILPLLAWAVAAPSIFLLWLYPFAKRFTDFPQAILGVQVAIGLLVGMAAHDPALLSDIVLKRHGSRSHGLGAVVALYLANACWTIIYDTVYAQQDVEDDAKAGVRSMAVHFRGRAKTLLWTVATVQVSLLILAGYLAGFGSAYFTVACGGVAASLGWMIATIDLGQPAECAWWFKNYQFVAGSIAGGLVSQCL